MCDMSVAVLEAEEVRIFGTENPIDAFLTSDEYTSVVSDPKEKEEEVHILAQN